MDKANLKFDFPSAVKKGEPFAIKIVLFAGDGVNPVELTVTSVISILRYEINIVVIKSDDHFIEFRKERVIYI